MRWYVGADHAGYELKQHQREFDAEHEWKPRIVNGIDCGEWVRKDGRPIFDD